MATNETSTALAVVLHDLAWLLPRTIGAEAAGADPLPLSELEIMRLLARRPSLSVNEVAAELGIRSTNVSTAIRALVGRGLLERKQDPSDARVVRLTPTPRAMRSRETREKSWGDAMSAVLASLPSDDRERLLASVESLRSLADRLAGREQ